MTSIEPSQPSYHLQKIVTCSGKSIEPPIIIEEFNDINEAYQKLDAWKGLAPCDCRAEVIEALRKP